MENVRPTDWHPIKYRPTLCLLEVKRENRQFMLAGGNLFVFRWAGPNRCLSQKFNDFCAKFQHKLLNSRNRLLKRRRVLNINRETMRWNPLIACAKYVAVPPMHYAPIGTRQWRFHLV